MVDIEDLIIEEIGRALSIKKEELIGYVSHPISKFGDLSISLALGKKDQNKVAMDIAEKIKNIQYISKVEVVNGYVNCFYNYNKIIPLLEKIDENYGKNHGEINKRIILEHTSANPNKAIHIGHVRNACIGDSLARLLRFYGYNVLVENYIDDTGAQVADNIVGIVYLNFPMKKEGIKLDHYFGDEVYVKVNQLYEKDKDLLEKRNEVLRKLEEGNNEITQISDNIVKGILTAQLQTLNKLNIFYDILVKESDIIRNKLWETTFGLLKNKEEIYLAKEGKNNGCWVYRDRKGNEKAITRKDGTVLYIGKDIAHAMWKLGLVDDPFKYKVFIRQSNDKELFETASEGRKLDINHNFSESINVIGSEQRLDQEIITEIIDKFSDGEKKYIHYAYELVYLSKESMKELGKEPSGEQTKMSGRKGLFFNVDDILDRLISDATISTKARNRELNDEEIRRIAEAIAISVIRYEMVKTDPNKAIVFDIKNTLKIEQGSATYLLYTIARINSILNKLNDYDYRSIDYDKIELSESDKELIRKLLFFPSIIRRATENLYLPALSNYVSDLSLSFNKWYENSPVLKAEDNMKAFRVLLIKCIKQTLINIFNILGIIPIERM